MKRDEIISLINEISYPKEVYLPGNHIFTREVFNYIRKNIDIDYDYMILLTDGGIIVDFTVFNSRKPAPIFSGRELTLKEFIEKAHGTLVFDNVPGYIIVTPDMPQLVAPMTEFQLQLGKLLDCFRSCELENRQLLMSLNAVNNPISIYDSSAHLLFANSTFFDYLSIKDREKTIGMEISEILKYYGISVKSASGEESPLKMYEVLEKGKPSIDWEVRIESPKGDVQHVSNDMYPVKDEHGKVTGMVEILRSRQQDVSRAKKLMGLQAEYTFRKIIGSSPAMKNTIATAKEYANSPFNVLITGESGVGKELFAHAIHNHSTRRNGSFVALNCASFPDNLIESELFGYAGGAFTGASKNGQIGKFELADGGTLFLDEIGELPFRFQSKLLRVLETWTITRIGASKPTPVNVRLIAATNRDLEAMVKEGLFREDLYYRLQVLSITVPPLRDRKDDIVEIAESFLEQYKDPYTSETKVLSPEAKDYLKSYDWPGNVRELRNVMSRASILSKSPVISRDIISSSITNKAVISPEPKISTETAASVSEKNITEGEREKTAEERLKDRLDAVDSANAALIREALELSGNNKTRAAQLLDVSRRTFYRMLEKYNID